MHGCLGQPLPDQPCGACVHYGGVAWNDASCAWCLRAGRRCQARPDRGCAFFERASDADDGWPGASFDDWRPPPAPTPLRPRPAAATARVLVEA